jgi:hypothetical protein
MKGTREAFFGASQPLKAEELNTHSGRKKSG